VEAQKCVSTPFFNCKVYHLFNISCGKEKGGRFGPPPVLPKTLNYSGVACKIIVEHKTFNVECDTFRRGQIDI